MPAPALLLGRGLGEGSRTAGLHIRHGKGQALDVVGDAEEHVAQRQGVDALQCNGAEENDDGLEPRTVEEAAL